MTLSRSVRFAHTSSGARNLFLIRQCRQYSAAAETLPPAPPLLLKLRTDLKNAMKQKDTIKLNVLRGLLADITNSAKTSNPIKTDMQLLNLLRKRTAASEAASEEFKKAGREDLFLAETDQIGVLQEYAGSVETISGDEVRVAAADAIAKLRAQPGRKVNAGEVLKTLLSPGGTLYDKPVEKVQVAKTVKDLLSQPS